MISPSILQAMVPAVLIHLLQLCAVQPDDKNQSELGGHTGTIGRVVHIVDGETYNLLTDENEKIRVRMEGIDTLHWVKP